MEQKCKHIRDLELRAKELGIQISGYDGLSIQCKACAKEENSYKYEDRFMYYPDYPNFPE